MRSETGVRSGSGERGELGAQLRARRPELVALDLDGTLLRSDKRVSERARRALAALGARGVRMVLCTGRPPRYVRELALQLQLPDAIVFNGAAAYDATRDRADYHLQLPRALALDAIARVRARFPGVMVGLETHHGWYLDTALLALRRPQLEAAGLALPDGHGDAAAFVRDAAVKLLFRHPERSASELSGALDGLALYRTWSSQRMLEVMADGVNKRVALERLAAELGVPRARVAAFGDQHNDREMLAWAGLGVAVANAAPAVREAADLVVGSNDDDGVAEVLEAWLEAPPARPAAGAPTDSAPTTGAPGNDRAGTDGEHGRG